MESPSDSLPPQARARSRSRVRDVATPGDGRTPGYSCRGQSPYRRLAVDLLTQVVPRKRIERIGTVRVPDAGVDQPVTVRRWRFGEHAPQPVLHDRPQRAAHFFRVPPGTIQQSVLNVEGRLHAAIVCWSLYMGKPHSMCRSRCPTSGRVREAARTGAEDRRLPYVGGNALGDRVPPDCAKKPDGEGKAPAEPRLPHPAMNRRAQASRPVNGACARVPAPRRSVRIGAPSRPTREVVRALVDRQVLRARHRQPIFAGLGSTAPSPGQNEDQIREMLKTSKIKSPRVQMT